MVFRLDFANGHLERKGILWAVLRFVVGSNITKLFKLFCNHIPVLKGKDDGFSMLFFVNDIFWMDGSHNFYLEETFSTR